MTTRRQLQKQEKIKLHKMGRMQPPKRTGTTVRKWCLKKMKNLSTSPSPTREQTMQRIHDYDNLMYFRLRRMLDGAWVIRREGQSKSTHRFPLRTRVSSPDCEFAATHVNSCLWAQLAFVEDGIYLYYYLAAELFNFNSFLLLSNSLPAWPVLLVACPLPQTHEERDVSLVIAICIMMTQHISLNAFNR